jgi:hypothetical protein
MGEGHYEVELRELLYEADGTGGLRVTGSMWKSVRVFNKDTVPMVLSLQPRPSSTSLQPPSAKRCLSEL